MNKTIKLFLLFLEVVFLFGQIFILFDYPNVTQTRNNYRDLMSQIGDFISQNKIDKEYKAKFEEVFGIYWDNKASGQGFLSILIFTTHFILGILLFIGVIINCFSAFMNKKQIPQICFFAYALIIAFFEFCSAFFEENGNLRISDSELIEKFSPLKEIIESSLEQVKRRILLLRIYSSILVISSAFHILSSIFFNKNSFQPSRANYPEQILVSENNINNIEYR